MSVSDIKKNTSLNDIKVAFIADDIKNLNEFEIFHNATFSLMLAAQELNVKILLTESNNLKIVNNKIIAKFDEVLLKREVGNHLKIKSSKEYSLDSLNVIFARKDPPVNENFITYTQMLSMISSEVLIVNNPAGILRANEKLYIFNVPDLIPITLVTSKKEELLGFLREHKEAVIKPLFNKGGEGVFYLNTNSINVNSIIEESLASNHTVVIQKYLSEVLNGDKRIIILNGIPIGGILRIPKVGEFRANIHRGASVKSYELSKKDYEICEKLKPYLLRDGLYFVAVDIIGDCLIEINVTCPAGIKEIEDLTNKKIAKEIVQWVLETVQARLPHLCS